MSPAQAKTSSDKQYIALLSYFIIHTALILWLCLSSLGQRQKNQQLATDVGIFVKSSMRQM